MRKNIFFPESPLDLVGNMVPDIARMFERQIKPSQPFDVNKLNLAMKSGLLCVIQDLADNGRVIGAGLMKFKDTMRSSVAMIEEILADPDCGDRHIDALVLKLLIERALERPEGIDFFEASCLTGQVQRRFILEAIGCKVDGYNNHFRVPRELVILD